MPNWCSNRIIIRGHDDHVRKFFLTIAEDDQHVGTLDFMKIIPMPKELDDTEESFNSFAMMASYLSAINPDGPDWGFEKVSERTYDDLIDKLSKVRPNVGTFEDAPTDFAGNGKHYGYTKEEWCNGGKKYLENYLNYGYPTWYSWCCANWDTKWPACGVEYDGNRAIKFDTAWSPAMPIFEKLAKDFPDITIVWLYTIEGWQNFSVTVIHDGELVSVFDEQSGNINDASGRVIQQIIEDAIYNYKDYDYAAFDTEYGSIWDEYPPYRTGKIKLIHDKYSEAEESA